MQKHAARQSEIGLSMWWTARTFVSTNKIGVTHTLAHASDGRLSDHHKHKLLECLPCNGPCKWLSAQIVIHANKFGVPPSAYRTRTHTCFWVLIIVTFVTLLFMQAIV